MDACIKNERLGIEKIKNNITEKVSSMFKKEEKIGEDNQIHTLGPVILTKEKYKKYKHLFDKIEKDKEITNVAITGEYGVGKSSVINTYLKEKKRFFDKYRTIRVSLRNFNLSVDLNEEEKIQALEQKILEQIINQVNAYKGHTGAIIYSCLLCIFLAAITFYFYVVPYTRFFVLARRTVVYAAIYKIQVQAIVFCCCFVFGLIFLICLICFLVNRIRCEEFSLEYEPIKISLKLQENGKASDMSLLSIYGRQIAYYIRRKKIKAVIIEDLDRFNNIEVFEHFKEISNLVNANAQNNPVCFFYLIKDSIFKNNGECRTKFFDLTIPVVPVVGHDNSWNRLKTLLGRDVKLSIKGEIRLEELCRMYIKDYRTIKNIANEFFVQKKGWMEKEIEKVSDEEINEKLLSIICYKNVFPEDYALLTMRKGYVYNYFKHTYVLIDEIKERKRQEKIDINRMTYGKSFSQLYHMILKMDMETNTPTKQKFDIRNNIIYKQGSLRLVEDCCFLEEYWEEIKKHPQFEMLDQLVLEDYISDLDYLKYIQTNESAKNDNLLFTYLKEIKNMSLKRTINFDTIISDDVLDNLYKFLEDVHYYSPSLVNSSIIEHLLDKICKENGEGKREAEKRLGRIILQCEVDKVIKIFNFASFENKKQWAVMVINSECRAWKQEIIDVYKETIVTLIVEALGSTDLKKKKRQDKLIRFMKEYYVDILNYLTILYNETFWERFFIIAKNEETGNGYKIESLDNRLNEKAYVYILENSLFAVNVDNLKAICTRLQADSLYDIYEKNKKIYKYLIDENEFYKEENGFLIQKIDSEEKILKVLQDINVVKNREFVVAHMGSKAYVNNIGSLEENLRYIIVNNKKAATTKANIYFIWKMYRWQIEVVNFINDCWKKVSQNSYISDEKIVMTPEEMEEFSQELEQVKKMEGLELATIDWLKKEFGLK